jgi:hypothetical protein
MTTFFLTDLSSTPVTVVAIAAAVIALYQFVLKDVFTSLRESNSELKRKLATVTTAYELSVLEVDTSMRIRESHRRRIVELERQLAIARGLNPDDVALHFTDSPER